MSNIRHAVVAGLERVSFKDRLPTWHRPLLVVVSRNTRRHWRTLALILLLGLPLLWIVHRLGYEKYTDYLVHWHGNQYLDALPKAEVELVFAATKSSNMSWTDVALADWVKNIYRVDALSAPLSVPRNKGREAMVFLTFIIDRYWNLPQISIFLHDQRYQWHNDNPLYDSVISIQDLQTNFIKSAGYVNLRCTWMFGCPAELEPARYLRERPDDTDHPTAMEFPDRFMELFPGVEVPEKVGIPCCSQFALSRDRIRERPVEDYLRYREWLIRTDLLDDTSGRIMEYSWHMIFGKPPQHCLDSRKCFCQTYGYCDMTDQQLQEQWIWRGEHLPEGWPSDVKDVITGRPG